MNARRNVIVLLGCFCLGIAVMCSGAFAEPISLQEAVRQNKVSVQVNSLGGATGNTVRVGVRRKVPEKVEVKVTPGTVFIAKSGKVQNMTGGKIKGEFTQGNRYRPTSVMVLTDDKQRSYLVESYCLDYGKPAPKPNEVFTLAVADQRATRILEAGKDTADKPSLWAYQSAIWMDRAGVSGEELQRRFGGRVTSVDVKVARQLLKSAEQSAVAEIPAGIAPDVKVEIARLVSSDPGTRAEGVKKLKEMGVKAAPAIPYLLANVIRSGDAGPLPATVVEVHAGPNDTAVAVEQLGLPVLASFVRELREGDAAEKRQEKREEKREEKQETSKPSGLFAGRVIGRRIARLKDDNPHVRQRAATTLGAMKDPRAVPPLIDALRDSDAQVQENAAEALKDITGKDYGKSKLRWSFWWGRNKDTVLR